MITINSVIYSVSEIAFPMRFLKNIGDRNCFVKLYISYIVFEIALISNHHVTPK